MPKVVRSLDLSSRGRSILLTSMDEHLTSLLKELLSTRTILMPGTFSASLGKVWALHGGVHTEITVTLNFRVEPPISPAKQAAVAAAFS
jgi:hypothetical protein